MELQDLIDRHHAAVAARSGHGAPTRKGAAVAALYRLVDALRQLGPDDRADVLALLAEETA